MTVVICQEKFEKKFRNLQNFAKKNQNFKIKIKELLRISTELEKNDMTSVILVKTGKKMIKKPALKESVIRGFNFYVQNHGQLRCREQLFYLYGNLDFQVLIQWSQRQAAPWYCN